jgi:hypothetical protein
MMMMMLLLLLLLLLLLMMMMMMMTHLGILKLLLRFLHGQAPPLPVGPHLLLLLPHLQVAEC